MNQAASCGAFSNQIAPSVWGCADHCCFRNRPGRRAASCFFRDGTEHQKSWCFCIEGNVRSGGATRWQAPMGPSWLFICATGSPMLS